jgi:flagellar protein FlaG
MSMTLPPAGLGPRNDLAVPAAVAPSPAERPPQSERGPTPADKSGALALTQAKRKELEQALAEANQRMQLNGRALAFSLDEKADRMVIRVTNSVTGELVRQIPDETVLRIAHSLDEIKGFLYDEAG